MRLNVYGTERQAMHDIAIINEKLERRYRRKENGITSIKVELDERNNIVYRITGTCTKGDFFIKITRNWGNLIEDDVKAIERCRTLREIFDLKQ